MCKTADVFRFSNQGIWVAVAYDDDFFIDTVLDVANFEVATVQFLNRGFKLHIDGQELMMLLKSGINLFLPLMSRLFLNANGRTYSVSEIEYLQQLYEEYAAEYFKHSVNLWYIICTDVTVF